MLCQVIMGCVCVSLWKLTLTSFYVGKKKDQSLHHCIYFDAPTAVCHSNDIQLWFLLNEYFSHNKNSTVAEQPLSATYLRNALRYGRYTASVSVQYEYIGYFCYWLCSVCLCNVRSTSEELHCELITWLCK